MKPIVTPKEMVDLEHLAYCQGNARCSEENFMERAGQGMARLISADKKWIHLLCGKGNNGADGLVALCYLLKAGHQVSCMRPQDLTHCSPLLQKQYARYIACGGKETEAIPAECDLILDGLFGTGFKGSPKAPFDAWIQQANASKIPIFAIDIPSGVDGETGEVQTVAIQAERTFYLELPKRGLFLQQGWKHAGKLERVDFGLPLPSRSFSLWLQTLDSVQLPVIKKDQHKYEAGYVAGVGGMGALFLAGFSALRSGCGIVKLFHTDQPLCQIPLELIHISYRSIEEIFPAVEHAKALFIGPGLGTECKNLGNFFTQLKMPLVLDADALNLIAKEKISIPAHSILTPHRGEFERLIEGQLSKGLTEELLLIGSSFSKRHQCTLVLKGSPTMIFHPETAPILCDRGDPGMATAGTGDVLTGIVAAFLAMGCSTLDAARFAVCVHGAAGEKAALEKGSRSLIATDLIAALPEILKFF